MQMLQEIASTRTARTRSLGSFIPPQLTVSLVLAAFSLGLHGQQPSSSTAQPKAGSSWQNVRALPANTKVHITTEHGGKTCRIFLVSDDTLTCAKGSNRPGDVLQRADIKHIKLTHYVRSALIGAGAGAGIGATAGAIAGRTKPCPAGQGLCLNGLGVGAGGVAAIFGVGGAVIGSVVGGVTDMARGSSIYTRP